MKTSGLLTLALGLAVVVAAPRTSNAQGGRGMMGGGMGGPMAGLGALMSPAGQKELSLSEEQIEKVREISENLRSTMMEKFQGLQDVPQEERQAKMQSLMKEVGDGVETELKGILKEDQLKRYKQITIQAAGLEAFSRDDVAKALELTADQKAKIKGIADDLRSEMMGLREQFQDDMQGAMKKMQELRAGALDKVKGSLTDKQKEQWTELTGKPFQMPAPGGPRRRID